MSFGTTEIIMMVVFALPLILIVTLAVIVSRNKAGLKKCSSCPEMIHPESTVCPFCRGKQTADA